MKEGDWDEKNDSISDTPKLLEINSKGDFWGAQRVVNHFTGHHHLLAATRPKQFGRLSAKFNSTRTWHLGKPYAILFQKQQPSRVTVAKNIYSIHEVYTVDGCNPWTKRKNIKYFGNVFFQNVGYWNRWCFPKTFELFEPTSPVERAFREASGLGVLNCWMLSEIRQFILKNTGDV